MGVVITRRSVLAEESRSPHEASSWGSWLRSVAVVLAEESRSPHEASSWGSWMRAADRR